jgi:serine/threonine-protein kinase RsbW
MDMKNIRIEVPALTENIRMIESFIDNAREKFQLDDDIYGNIMIAVTEAVNNAIKHGSKSDKNKNVLLSLSLEETTIKFRVEDQGEGFNFNNLPDPTSPENLEKPGGRGIFLMKHLSDEVDFKDGGRVVELSFYMNA